MPSKTPSDRLLTLAELAAYLHIGKNTVLELAQDKKIPGALIDGKEWRFRREAVDEWLDQQASGEEMSLEEAGDGMKLPLGDFMPESAIIHDMRARDAIGAIEELAGRAYQSGWLKDKPWFVGAVVEREALASTAMEGGVAFLHTRSRDTGRVGRPFIVFGRSYDGIEFGAPDGDPTYLFFLLGLTHDRLHLPLLGRLARVMTRDPSIIARLRSTTSPMKMRNLLLKLDADEMKATAPAPTSFGKSSPKLDREMRLRAIMRLNARRRHEANKEQAAAAKTATRKKASEKAAATRKATAAAKKAAATKAAAKKPAAKKPAAKKATAAKKPAAKKATAAKKPAAKKATAAKKPAAQKATAKKTAAKKPTVRKSTAKSKSKRS